VLDRARNRSRLSRTLALFAVLACRKEAPPAKGARVASAEEAQERMAIKREGCVERRRRISADEVLPYGFSAAQLFLLPEGPEQAPLTWESGEQTTVRFTFGPGSLFFVKSEGDPSLPGARVAYCRDHVLMRGPVHLWTDDGRLDERWSVAQARTFLGRAEMTLKLDRRAIRGKYPALPPPSACLVDLQFDLLFTSAGMSGLIFRSVAYAPCEAIGPRTAMTRVSDGRWGWIPGVGEPGTYVPRTRSSGGFSPRRPRRSAGLPAHPR
jgi:hypothetical protein